MGHSTLLAAPKVHISKDAEVPALLKGVDSLHFAHPNISTTAVAFIAKAGAQLSHFTYSHLSKKTSWTSRIKQMNRFILLRVLFEINHL